MTEEQKEEFEPILFPRMRKKLREKRVEWKEQRKQRTESRSNLTDTRGITDLVRSQFDFTCPVCEEIAEKVSSKLSNRTDQTRVYEAVYKLSSSDKKAQNEAIATLGELNVLKDVMDEIKGGWEKLKGKPD